MLCPHCEAPLFRKSGDGSKLKAKTSIFVMHRSGDAEINCKSCGQGVILPLTVTPEKGLRKAIPSQRFVVRKVDTEAG